MNRIALAALLAVCFAAPAYAADMYAGVRLGQAKYNISGLKDIPSAFGVFGGYTVNPNFAVEAEYVDLGSFALSSAAVEAISALFFYPGNEPFSLYAKVSYASSTWKMSNQVQRNSALTHGLGCQYDATPLVNVRFGWDRYMIGNQVAINVDVLSVSGMIKF